jgi:uncharacterized integral membrane protein
VNDPEVHETTSIVTPKRIASLILLVLLVIFWAQNRTRVKITFWVADATVRVWIALLLASAVGFIAGFLARGRRD